MSLVPLPVRLVASTYSGRFPAVVDSCHRSGRDIAVQRCCSEPRRFGVYNTPAIVRDEDEYAFKLDSYPQLVCVPPRRNMRITIPDMTILDWAPRGWLATLWAWAKGEP